jgi:large subunit ribosomal protein L3
MTRTLLKGKKCGMTQRFDGEGNVIPCTVIQIEPNVVTQIKRRDHDGYEAIQLASDRIEVSDERTLERRVTKPLIGHFKKASVAPHRSLHEIRVEDASGYELGQKLGVEQFQEVAFVDVTGTSRGKGYQGVMKKYGFAGGPAAHGSGFHRHAGSTGNRSTPGRCFPGSPRPSHMGDETKTVMSLRVVAVDAERNVLLVRGAVPGAVGSVVTVGPAVKKRAKKQ